MAKVSVSHPGFASDESKTAPKRVVVPPGRYAALLVKAEQGSTRHKEPLSKISCEFQILHQIDEDGKRADVKQAGRRVFQDYILEYDSSMPDMSEQRRYELRMLIDACEADFSEDGFELDDLQNKKVIITVKHREGSKMNDDGTPKIFTNVVAVDTGVETQEGDLI